MIKKTKVVGSIAVAGMLVTGLMGGLAGAYIFPTEKTTEVVIPSKCPTVICPEIPVCEPIITTEIIEKEVIVEKDIEFMYLRLNELIAEDKAIDIAMSEVKKDLLYNLYKEGMIKNDFRADVVEIFNDIEDITITKSDFDYDEYEFIVKVKVDDRVDRVKKTVSFVVEVVRGKPKILNIF